MSKTVSASRRKSGKTVQGSKSPGAAKADQPAESLRLLDSAPVLVRKAGVDGKWIWFNKFWLEFTGRTMQQELGNGWTEGLHPQDLNSTLSDYQKAFQNQVPFELEYRLRNKSGEYRWIHDLGMPVFAKGRFTGYLVYCFDLSKRVLPEFSGDFSLDNLK